jgi:NADPH:quinone reductase
MKTMKGWCFAEYGPPAVLEMKEMSIPQAAAGEVQVRVLASAVNPSDVKNVAGAFHASLPRVPGRDYVGVVVAGSDAWQGKEVWGSGPGFGVRRDGAHAQYVLVPIDGLAEKPARLSVADAATVGVPYLAAWSALIDAAAIRQGETLLVTGAAGAVGRAAIQIAHWKGARVIGADLRQSATTADEFIITKDKDLPTEVKSLTGGRGVDAVLDCVGGPLFEPALNSLRRGGRQVAITSVGKRRVEFDLLDFYHQERRLIGVDTVALTGADIARIMSALGEGFDQGHLEPSPATTRPFAEAVKAYEEVASGRSSTTQILLLEPG